MLTLENPRCPSVGEWIHCGMFIGQGTTQQYKGMTDIATTWMNVKCIMLPRLKRYTCYDSISIAFSKRRD